MGEPGDLDEHDGPCHFVVAVIGDPSAAVNVDDDTEFLAKIPKRLVDRLPKWWEPATRWDRRKEDPGER